MTQENNIIKKAGNRQDSKCLKRSKKMEASLKSEIKNKSSMPKSKIQIIVVEY